MPLTCSPSGDCARAEGGPIAACECPLGGKGNPRAPRGLGDRRLLHGAARGHPGGPAGEGLLPYWPAPASPAGHHGRGALAGGLTGRGSDPTDGKQSRGPINGRRAVAASNSSAVKRLIKGLLTDSSHLRQIFLGVGEKLGVRLNSPEVECLITGVTNGRVDPTPD
eukprot:1339342-Pyramimonas_sp.AAC.1